MRPILSTPRREQVSMPIATISENGVTAREQYREAVRRANRATDRDIEEAERATRVSAEETKARIRAIFSVDEDEMARRAVERISDRPAKMNRWRQA